jgi:hypothetical protein
VTPARRGVNPNYGQFDGSLDDRLNKVQHLVSSIDNKVREGVLLQKVEDSE